jgi:purine-binding chemotaxis protein CheW
MSELSEIRGRSNSFLSFLLGDERFATHVAHVNIILEIPKITKVPRTPDYMKGVVNHRGIVLPVFDLRLKMSMPENDYTNNTCILVLEIELDDEKVSIGAIVDSVHEVLEIHDNQVQPPPNMGNNENEKYIYGIAKVDDDFIMLLDMNKIFSTNDNIDPIRSMQGIDGGMLAGETDPG